VGGLGRELSQLMPAAEDHNSACLDSYAGLLESGLRDPTAYAKPFARG